MTRSAWQNRSIAVCTPTKNRPEQLKLVAECMRNQTKKPEMWVICTDYKDQLPTTELHEQLASISGVKVKYVLRKDNDEKSTCRNTAYALMHAEADRYVMFDDDDYYPRTYIEFCSKLPMEEDSLWGQRRWPDYRLSTGYYRDRWKSDEDVKEPTLCEWHSSVIQGEKLKQTIIELLRNKSSVWNDAEVFNNLLKTKQFPSHCIDFGEHSVISLKDYGVGLRGTISAHRTNNGMTADDENFSKFKEWLGEDWVRYKQYLGRLR